MLGLIVGGAASGKSEHGERLAQKAGGKKLYVATMEPFGEEARARIEKHRRQRAQKGFDTAEIYTGLAQRKILGYDTILLECLTNLLANERFSAHGAKEDAARAVLEGIASLRRQSKTLIVVSGDLFCDGIGYDQGTRQYLQDLGQIHRELAQQADFVAESVCGILIPHRATQKGCAFLCES